MEIKTNESYKREILEKYKREKGGEMRGYLATPTRSQIRDACIYLFHRRKKKNDEYILNRFFQFKNDDNKLREIQNFGEGRFRSIEKFLKGEVKNTSEKNLNLISWLIDFNPRPRLEYIKSENLEQIPEPESDTIQVLDNVDILNDGEFKKKEEEERERLAEIELEKKKRKKKKWIITISISIVFGAILLTNPTIRILNFNDPVIVNPEVLPKPNQCMTWVGTHYKEVTCISNPYSNYGTAIEEYNSKMIRDFEKVNVTMATQFFTEDGKKPLIWYYKNKKREIEYFTAPGLHPVHGATLKKITTTIINKYVPLHTNKSKSFIP